MDLQKACADRLAPWESKRLAELKHKLGGKSLVSVTTDIRINEGSWYGPEAFRFYDPAISLRVRAAVSPPPNERGPRSWFVPMVTGQGGVIILRKTPEGSLTSEDGDVLIGGEYAGLALRELECEPNRGQRLQTMGDETVYTNTPPELGTSSGWRFAGQWLGRTAVKVIVLPMPKLPGANGPFTRWRLNPSTSDLEFVEYDKEQYYLIIRIISKSEIQEISYNDYGIEKIRRVYKNLGNFRAGVRAVAKEGRLLRSCSTKRFIFDKDDARKRQLLRECKYADGSTRLEISTTR